MTDFVMMMMYSIGFDWKFETPLSKVTTNTKNGLKKPLNCGGKKDIGEKRGTDKRGERTDIGHFSKGPSIEFLSI